MSSLLNGGICERQVRYLNSRTYELNDAYKYISSSSRQQTRDEPSHGDEEDGEQTCECSPTHTPGGQGRVCYLLVNTTCLS